MRTLPRLQTHIGDHQDPPGRIPPAQNLEDPVPTLHVCFSSNRIPISLIISSFSARRARLISRRLSNSSRRSNISSQVVRQRAVAHPPVDSP